MQGKPEQHNTDLVLHTEVRWSSKGAAFDRFWELLPEIREFLKTSGADVQHQFLSAPMLKTGLGTRSQGHYNVNICLCLMSGQVRLLCPWARHLTGRPRLYVEDRWPSFPSEERVGGRKGIRPQNKCHVIKMQISAVATPNRE